MKSTKILSYCRFITLAWLALAVFNTQFSTSHAQGTAFTYQGRLNSSGSSANGNYDFTFALFNNSTGSSGQVGSTLTLPDVGVTNGLFTVTLDFGANFPGASRWLAIGVRTNGAASFTALSPLQELDPTPYAIYAPNAGVSASASSVAATNISGAIPLGQLAGTVLTNGGTNVTLTGTFSGNGGGLTNLAGWQLLGNTGTTTNNFLGTTDNQSLQIRVGGAQAGLFTPSNGSPNIVLGAAQNVISNGTAGASILGGVTNTIGTNSSYSVIGGGNQNGIQQGAGYSFLGSGLNNTIQTNATYSVLGGGQLNSIQSGTSQAVLGGGLENIIQTGASQAFLGGGQQNTIQNGGSQSFVGAGVQNSMLSSDSFIGGGYFNSIAGSSADSVLGGGHANSIGFDAGGSVVGGGQQNTIAANADHSVIVGGGVNNIFGADSVIVGGYGNNGNDFYGFIGGGGQNTLTNGQYSTLVAGQLNSVVDAYYAFVGGGLQNTNSANYAFIGGGLNNLIGTTPNAGLLGSLSGGQSNTVNGNWGTIPGGASNVANGQFSFAAGANAQATNNGAFVWSDAEGTAFPSTNANSFNVRANGGARFVTGGVGLTVDGSPVLAGNSGSGLINLNASQLTSGTVPLARLPSSVVTNNEPSVPLGSLTLTGNLSLPLPAQINAGTSFVPFLYGDNNGNALFGFAGKAGIGGVNNIGIGVSALLFNAGGSNNTAIGIGSMLFNTSGSNNVAVGDDALADNTGGTSNVAVGNNALSVVGAGNNNIGLGDYAGNSLTSGNNNIYIGNPGAASESGIIRIGTSGTQTQTYVAGELFADSISSDGITGTDITATNIASGGVTITGNGSLALPSPASITSGGESLLSAYGRGNVSLGLGAGGSNGFEYVALGDQALGSSAGDGGLVAIGFAALQSDIASDNPVTSTGDGESTAVGDFSLFGNTTGGGNTALGYGSLSSNTNGGGNTAEGWAALINNTSGSYNTANGFEAMGNLDSFSSISGNNNTADGAFALGSIAIGTKNVACGFSALGDSQTGTYNVAVGDDSIPSLESDSGSGGGGNTAVGAETLFNLTTGSGNIAIGFLAGKNNTAGNDNIYIGNQGVDGDNDIIYIGTAGTQVATYLAGNVYAEKNVYAATVQLTSDRNMKENFQPVDNQAVLAKVAALPVTQWNYKADKAAAHIGPMAQDFQAAFGLDGADDKHISVVDEGGVALAAIQGLNQKLNEKDAEIQDLKQSLVELKKMVESLVRQPAAIKN